MQHKLLKISAFLVAGLLSAPAVLAQQWSSPIKLTAGGTPDLTIDRRTGDVHVLVMNNKVIHVVLSAKGKKLSQQDVPNSSGPIGKFRFGATIAVDANSDPHVAFHRHTGNNKYDGFYTYKSGSSWSNALKFASDAWRGYGMRMAIDDDNDVHLIYGVPDVVGAVSATATYFRIENGAIVHTVTGLQKWRIEDHLEIDTFGKNDIHVLLSRPDRNGKVYYHSSDDNGTSFSGPTNIRTGSSRERPGNGDLFTDAVGNVHMVYGTGEDQNAGVQPAVRYHLRSGGNKIRDVAVTDPGELLPWHLSSGIGTVAASDDGRQVVVAYLVTDGGELRARISNDQGVTWNSPVSLANQSGCCEGRDKPVIRANGRRFYVAYESGGDVYLRWIELGSLPPLASAGGPYSGDEGEIITFDASLSSADGQIAQYAWDWNNDGIYDDSSSVATFDYAYPDDYNGLLALRITDASGAVDTAQVSVSIANVAPVVSVNVNATPKEGDAVTFAASISDPGANDILGELFWDFGDGQSGTGLNPTHTFADNGDYEVVASVTDDDGDTGTATLQVTVQNAAPVANAGGPYVAVIDESITFTGSATDPGSNDMLTFSWDLDNDGVFEKNGSQASRVYATLGTFSIRFKATDNDGDSDVDITQVTVGNGGPLALPIPNQQIDEGQSFPQLNLDDFVNDPNNTANEITWTFSGNTNLAVALTNRQVTVSVPNPDWWGQDTIRFVAKDPTGYTDSTDAIFIVNPINDPPVLSEIPNQTAVGTNAIFQPILLDNYVTDIDDPKSALIWRASGFRELFVTVANRVATVTRPNTSWFGSEVITFTVTDTSNASDTVSVRFTAKQNNDPPVLSEIPSQTIFENQTFAPIDLDQYVDDPDNNDEEMSWSVFGHKELKVSISIDRLVTIAPPDSEWAKSERISFVARDPWNNADTSTATFTVNGINDPPVIAALGEYTINEDDSVFFALQDLPGYVTDPDHALGELQFDFIGQSNLRVIFDEQRGLIVYPAEDWHGQESAWLRVSDGVAWNIAQIKITAIAQPDAPKIFDLLLPVFNQNYLTVPENIEFSWAATHDPDIGDSLSHYTWQLSAFDDFSTLITSAENLTDTTTTLAASLFLRQPATFQKYYWRVIAHSSDGSSTANRPHQGRFTLGIVTGIEDETEPYIPNAIALRQNYPNPFNPSTLISYQLPMNSAVKITIYNLQGQLVRTLVHSSQPAGSHRVLWDATDDRGQRVPSGVYIYQLETPQQTLSRKMILMQ